MTMPFTLYHRVEQHCLTFTWGRVGGTLYYPEVSYSDNGARVREWYVRAETVVRFRWDALWLVHVSILGFGLAVSLSRRSV